MSIVSQTFGLLGQTGVSPRRVQMVVTDNLTILTTAGYLNEQGLVPNTVYPTDIFDIIYSYNTVTTTGTYGEFLCTISAGVITLVPYVDQGNVLLPVVSGDFAVFNGTSGQIKDAGYSASNAAKTKVVMANGAVIANHIATYADTAGTISDDAATAINGGNIQAGLSGTAGTVASFPGTSLKGSLVIKAVANTGNTLTTISNAAMGQASVISIPDPAAATANIAVAPAALVNNNLIEASGTAGLIADAGIATANVMLINAVNTMSGSGQIILVKANGTEAANAVTASGNAGVITTSSLTVTAGSTYVITWTNTKITATSVIGLTVQGGSNANQDINFTCVPGSSTATLTIYNTAPATSISGTILIGYTVL